MSRSKSPGAAPRWARFAARPSSSSHRESVFGGIARERFGCILRGGERNVAIGAQQIGGVTLDRKPRLPAKDAQRQILFAAPARQRLRSRPVHLALPAGARQRLVVVMPVEGHPRHAIPAMHLGGPALTDRTVAVIECQLSNGAEQELARGLNPEYTRRDERCKPGAHQCRDGTVGRCERENTIGGRNEAARKGDAL